MTQNARSEPFAAKLHFIPRAIRGLQTGLVNRFRGYFSHAPGWVLLGTIGRRTGLPRETLLPCVRADGTVIVISTYGSRSDWIRNLRKNPAVKVTRDGAVVSGRAEVVEDLAKKRALVSEHPFFAPAPFKIVNAIALGVFRPALVAFLRRWVTVRPIVVIHL
jgi:deazaflavin-dependent oxidoreductase (nitroreductase family)